jgi:beta-phosphoglucomutase-like phosphatase (HAD superfamily)
MMMMTQYSAISKHLFALPIKILIMVASLITRSESLSSPPSRNKLSGVLFDIDGTLVNSDPLHQAVFRELLLREEGFNDYKAIDEEFFRENIAGRQNALIMADLFPEWPIEKREEWSVQKEARFREVAASSLMERKMSGLDKLKAWIEDKDLPRAAVTNAPRLNAEAMISGIDYNDGFFQTLVIGDECEKPKPDPCPYLTACKNLGIDASGCIVFEDSPSGTRAGVAAGAFVIGILSGQEESALLEAGCSLVIKDFTDMKLWDYLASRL